MGDPFDGKTEIYHCIEGGKEIASSSRSPDRAPGEHFCSDLGRNLCKSLR